MPSNAALASRVAQSKNTGVPDQRYTVPLRFTLHRIRDTTP